MGAPYKWTMTTMIAIVLITDVVSARAVAPVIYDWFAMGMVLFVGRDFKTNLASSGCLFY